MPPMDSLEPFVWLLVVILTRCNWWTGTGRTGFFHDAETEIKPDSGDAYVEDDEEEKVKLD